MIEERCLFLAGSDRSGVGLLTDILDEHPDIAISRRINFWTFYAGKYGALDVIENLDRCLEDMWRFRRVTDLGIDREDVRRRFMERGDSSYPGLFRVIGESHALARGKKVWGDKSLNAERHADVIFASFPGARIVHVLRDPRDRHLSVMSHRGGKRAGLFGTTAVWVDSERRATRNSARYGSRYLVLRYEDLVDDPVSALTAACDLVGVRFAPSLLDESHGTPVHSRSVGRFETNMTAVETSTIERLARTGMGRRHYEPEGPEMSWPEAAAVNLGFVPLGRALIGMWKPWSWTKRRYWSRPSRRRLSPE